MARYVIPRGVPHPEWFGMLPTPIPVPAADVRRAPVGPPPERLPGQIAPLRPEVRRAVIPPPRPPVPEARRAVARLGQWEALIPVAAGLVQGLMDGGGGSGGAGGGVTQLTTQTVTLTPIQTQAVNVQTADGSISSPPMVAPVPIPRISSAPGGPTYVAPGGVPQPIPGVVTEAPPVTEAGIAGLPWWVLLLGGGVALWFLMR